MIRTWALCAVFFGIWLPPALGQSDPDHLLGKRTTTVVPEKFLRGYDPITVFFPRAAGVPGPLDDPGVFMNLSPAHPGTYRWLDNRTLQFQPTIAWPALERFSLRVRNKRLQLVTLMAPPTSFSPASGSIHLDPFRDLTLRFAHPIRKERLARMISMDVRPIPGLSGESGYTLTSADFSIKSIERQALDSEAVYVLTLKRELPYGHEIHLHLKLSADESLPGNLATYQFATKPVFKLTAFGAGSVKMPVASEGSVYSRDQAFQVGSGSDILFLEFSDQLGPISLEQVKRMVRFEPAVEAFRFQVNGKRLQLHFKGDRRQAYRFQIQPVGLLDANNRTLTEFGPTEGWFFIAKTPAYVRWKQRQGILERLGPQQLPMEARGVDRLDVRLYKIDPKSRSFWPFGNDQHSLDENHRPAGPGEEPEDHLAVAEQIRQLGSPLISRILHLPGAETGSRRQFGLDLKPLFSEISGAGKPGSYLVGYRPIGRSSVRHYARVQVTDLSLSTVEEERGVLFVVTSLSSGQAIAGAKVTVEGLMDNEVHRLLAGTTDQRGWFHYSHDQRHRPPVFRIIVEKDDDTLVLDPQLGPPHFFDNHWYGPIQPWLAWLNNKPSARKSRTETKVYLFTERPVYRPEDPVFIKGYLRSRTEGRFSQVASGNLNLVVEGPGDKRWTFPLGADDNGSFHHRFEEKDLPTGNYRCFVFNPASSSPMGLATFKKEAYRIPRFEVRLSAPDQVPLDKPFDVTLTADYYAGGRVVDQEVTWKTTVAAYPYRAAGFEGFTFSSDARFSSASGSFDAAGTSRVDRTDDMGSSVLAIDPTLEQDQRPRRYLVEATVRGADEQSVSATKTVLALPPFSLGLKLEKIFKQGETIRPQILAMDHEGKPLEGREVTVRLLHRQWHSYLRESDFTTGEAQYVTDVVDVELKSQSVTTAKTPQSLNLSVTEAGVYIVECTARDRLGRLQKVSGDFFLRGETPISWKKPKSLVFDTAWDKTSYNPGETATLLLKSPFQKARALIVVEDPGRNRYYWVNINRGQGSFTLPVEAHMTPRIPVHALLMRGRLPGRPVTKADHAKPVSMGSTAWVKVNPKAFRLNVAVNHPAKNLPGTAMPLEITMADPDGKPLNGEVTLWLVDRAVLALGKEGNLDPLKSLMQEHRAWVRLRGTRNETTGNLPLEGFPGGDGSDDEEGSLFGKVTVRRNFKTVPYYNPKVDVVNGKAQLTIDLPDNLTDFALRVVGTDQRSRFGFARSKLSIRLPVIVQSALPRFVRPGDSFQAGGIGRIVEGEGGPGLAQIEVEGLALQGEDSRSLDWVPDRPETLYFPLSVATQAALPGETENQVSVKMAVRRDGDGASDGFEVTLPIKPDRQWQYRERFHTVNPGTSVLLPQPEEPPRNNSLTRELFVTRDPALLKMLAGLQYLMAYPHGCTEQRISRMLSELAMGDLLQAVGRANNPELIHHHVTETLAYLKKAQNRDGLYSFWPGSRGYVSLTAYVVEFLAAVKDAGFGFEAPLMDDAVRALKDALRSDYRNFIEGYRFLERADALNALARVGAFDEAYAFELAARAQNMTLYGEAKVLRTLLDERVPSSETIQRLGNDLWNSLTFALENGTQVYQGLQYRAESWDGLILASEARTMAGVARALHRLEPEDERLKPLLDALVARGEGDGWGSTRANAAVLTGLMEILKRDISGPGPKFTLKMGQTENVLETGTKAMVRHVLPEGSGSLTYAGNEAEGPTTLWLKMAYLPQAGGDRVPSSNQGFVVDRRLLQFDSASAPPLVHAVTQGAALEVPMGSLLEEHVRLVNPEDRYFVAVEVPFAAGLEPLNPNLETSSSDAVPRGKLTLKPSYALYEDDRVVFYYDQLPKGTYEFFFRLRASFQGQFTHPPARAELMYRQTVFGRSPGAKMTITPKP